jgi:hypothetical protein
MKLTLWQQFSSNHSANFTVVGQFETVEEAQRAEDEINRFTRDVLTYWQGLSEEERAAKWDRVWQHCELTPPEIKWRDELGLTEYTRGIDWIREEIVLEKAVSRYKNLVFVRDGASTRTGRQPFDEMLRHLGGTTAFWQRTERYSIRWQVAFDTESIERANWWKTQFELLHAWANYITDGKVEIDLPHADFTIWPEIQIDGQRVIARNIDLGLYPEHVYLIDLHEALAGYGAQNIEFSSYGVEG